MTPGSIGGAQPGGLQFLRVRACANKCPRGPLGVLSALGELSSRMKHLRTLSGAVGYRRIWRVDWYSDCQHHALIAMASCYIQRMGLHRVRAVTALQYQSVH
jgi:hypothetical protein